jgi:hypothetical protein
MGEKLPELRTSEADGIIHEARVEWGKLADPPECRMAPTAVDRETLLGRTRKLFRPGMMRKP